MHVDDALMGGVEHCRAAGQHHVDLRAHDAEHLLVFGDVEFGQAGGAAEVGKHADLAAVVGQAAAQDGLGAVFKHRGLYGAVDQQALAGFPVGAVGGIDAALIEEQAVAAGQAGVAARQVQQPGHQAGHALGALGAGNANNGNAAAGAVVQAVRLSVIRRVGKQVVANRAAHRSRRPLGGLEVHQQPGAGVDLDNGAALRVQRARDVLRHHIHAGDVQAHHARGERHDVVDLGVDFVGAVNGHIAVALDQHLPSGSRHGLRRQALALQVQHNGFVLVGFDAAEGKVFFQAAPRVGVELGVHQLHHGRVAVAGDGGGLAPRCGHHAAAHHQQAVFMAAYEALHHHLAAMRLGHAESRFHFFPGVEVQRHAAAVVAVGGLDDHRQADVFRGFPGLLRAADDYAFRHGHAAGGEQAFRQVLVMGNAFGDGAGEVGLGGPDAALAGAVTQLDQVAVVQANVRNAAVGGGRHDGRGAGAEVAVIDPGADFLHRNLYVGRAEGFVVDGGHQQPVAFGERRAGHLFVARPEHHAVDAAFRGAARLAKAGRHVGQVQQLDHHMLQHMAGPGAFAQALDEAAALADAAVVLQQGGQQGDQPVIEAGQQVGRAVFQAAQIQPDFQNGPVSPDVGAAQVVDAQ